MGSPAIFELYGATVRLSAALTTATPFVSDVLSGFRDPFISQFFPSMLGLPFMLKLIGDEDRLTAALTPGKGTGARKRRSFIVYAESMNFDLL